MEKRRKFYQIQKERAEEATIRIDMWLRNQKGQGTVEYLLVTAVIVMAVAGAGAYFGEEIKKFFGPIVERINKFISGP